MPAPHFMPWAKGEAGGALFQLPSALVPATPQAHSVAALWWGMLAVAAVVFVLVMAVLLLGRWRAHRRGDYSLDDIASRRLVVIGGLAVPLVVLTVLVAVSLLVGRPLSARWAPADTPTIEITGHRWWWEVRYLGADGGAVAITANEIHVPVGRPVRVLLRSSELIHSFWVPNLQGKTDLIPGRTTTSWFEARRPGRYRGQCAEFCGTQHAHMAFLVIAQDASAFTAWLARQRQPAEVPQHQAARQGRRIFARDCANCHMVRELPGPPLERLLGPDLTHLAGRETLAAATLPNTPGHLAGWITDPQSHKPGSLMPPVPLSPAELRVLLAYLETLQ